MSSASGGQPGGAQRSLTRDLHLTETGLSWGVEVRIGGVAGLIPTAGASAAHLPNL